MTKKEKMLEVKLIKSLNRRTDRQIDTVKGLGLRRINHVVTLQDTPAIRGMINKVSFLLHVEEI
ncbi:MAG: 50S ribosomal protein L30 [Gammaproteobacteria bacterium]|nr:50S ribosomal protein L30 [Gammaproteobacteria bacterium]